MLFAAVTLLIAFGYYLLAHKLKVDSFGTRLVVVGLLSCAQIILTQLIAGIAGLLYLSVLVTFNVMISAAVIAYSRMTDRCEKEGIARFFLRDSRIVKESLRPICSWENTVLIILGAFVSSWIVIAAYFLPPRGVDDLTYHLPAIFQHIVSHKITLLPPELRTHFAFPQNSEFLFMWPAIFFHSQKLVDAVNLFMAIFGAAVIYAFSRMLNRAARESSFIALLFLFTPVVMMQAGSNYIDIITSVFFLLSLYFSALFYLTTRPLYLYCAGISLGLMAGTKYTMPFLAIPLQFFILPALVKKRRWHQLILYLFLIMAFGGFWYVRNYLILGRAFYPMRFFKSGMNVIKSGGKVDIVRDVLFSPEKWKLLCLDDAGLGTYDGGFGLIFWCLAFPSLIYVLVMSMRRLIDDKGFSLMLWLPAPIGFLMLLFVPVAELKVTARFGLFIVPIGLLAFGEVLQWFKNNRVFSIALKSSCVFFSLLSASLLSTAATPTYRLDVVKDDIVNHRHPSEYKYLMSSPWVFPLLRYAWEPLDYLTKDDSRGISCYVASSWDVFWLAPVYGSRLQNRIWNVENDYSKKPDACIFLFGPESEIFYLGRKIAPQEILSDPEYILITQADRAFCAHPTRAFLFMKKAFFENNGKKRLLVSYYRDTWPLALEAAERFRGFLEKDIPIVTSDPIGYGMRCLESDRRIENKVYFVPHGSEEEVCRNNSLSSVYSFGRPLDGFSSSAVKSMRAGDKEVVLYKNTRPGT